MLFRALMLMLMLMSGPFSLDIKAVMLPLTLMLMSDPVLLFMGGVRGR